MGKKHSSVKKNGESNGPSSSGNIFKTLFGEIAEQGQSASIFSDDNPFRRKPSEPSQTPQQNLLPRQLGFGSAQNEEIPENGKFQNPNAVEGKKRKRIKEKVEVPDTELASVGEGSAAPLEISKSKKKKTKASVESENFGSELKAFSKKAKGKYNLGKDASEDLNLGAKLKERDEEENHNVGMELNGVVDSEKKSKKKRKRDELESEYEVRRYGELLVKDESGERGLGGGAVVGEKRKTLDSAEDMLVSKEGFDDEDKLLRTVFVGNLPLKVKKKALLREFSQFGDVDSVRIRSVPIINSKTPRKGAIIKKQLNDSVDSVHAYIVFKTEDSAQASLRHNMGVVGGNHIRVDRACPPRKKLKGENVLLYDSKRTVFVGNLPFDVKDEEIYQLFTGVNNLESSIEAIRVIRDPGTSMGKGIAYVLFKTKGSSFLADVELVQETINASYLLSRDLDQNNVLTSLAEMQDAANLVVKKRNLKIRDRDLRLYRSKSNSTPSKRNYLSPAEQKNSPAKKKFVAGSRTPDGKVKTMSYQGLRASKSGVQKKVHTKKAEPVKFKSSTQKAQKPKERTGKRPSVAARKANALKGSVGGGGSKQAGKKRKVEGQTPDSSHRNKKARKFR